MRSPRLTPVGFVLLGLAVLGTPPAQGASEPEVLSQIETIRLSSDTRSDLDFDSGWRFSQGDFPSAPVPAFQDTKWRIVNLPHDWSIEGPFGPEYASGNGYAAGGVGWYRKHFRTDASVGGKLVRIEFDGVYNHAEVWINGQFIGERPYGYSSFECDLTPHLKAGSGENVVAVRVDHSRFADSRWYTGSGIYRHVRLRITDKLRVAHWGTFVTSPEVTADRAVLQIETAVENDTGARREFSLQSEILTPDGQVAGALTTTNSLDNATNLVVTQRITIQRPQLWSLDAPHQYTLRSRLSTGSALVDQATTQFGIRTLRFDPDNGFFLNDQPLKLKGVCVHHEAGCLGAAVPEKVWERRLRTLKEMGVNAIRTSHNPPAPEFLDLCDRLGLLVKDEAFDEFTPAKNKWVSGRNNGQPARFGYAEDFAEWSERDIADMVRRDRNHPSVIMWSIGNELDYGNDPFSHPALGSEYHPENPSAENLVKMARPLIRAVKQLDSTRPVTAALATVAMSDAVGLPDLLDVVGYNYQESRYPADHARHPRRFIFGSETSHQYRDWAVVRDNDYVAGQFLWTGIDYLGEANRWPNRGSGAGLLDLCGFKKPLAWFRQSLWSDKAMVYLCTSAGGSEGGRFSRLRVAESWNWPTNATVTVRCYTTCPEVRLTLNGTIIGVKHLTNAVDGALSWEVPFAPGELKAIGLAGDKSAAEYALKTAGAPSRIELLPDTRELSADGRDICHVEFRVVDAQGTRVPDAANEVTFDLDGPAKLPGIENGDLNSPVDYTSHNRKAFHGRGLAIVQSAAAAGTITLRATSPGLESASVTISSVTRANATR
jgi:beta-galactosidase